MEGGALWPQEVSMAGPEHLAILKRGVEEWNAWRREHGEICPERSGANLCATTLREASLHKVHLDGDNLGGGRTSTWQTSAGRRSERRLYGANLSGLLRQYLPKRTSLAGLTQRDCDAIAHCLNTRPRKRLGYRTPEECLYER